MMNKKSNVDISTVLTALILNIFFIYATKYTFDALLQTFSIGLLCSLIVFISITLFLISITLSLFFPDNPKGNKKIFKIWYLIFLFGVIGVSLTVLAMLVNLLGIDV